MSINRAILKVAQANPEFRKALTAELKKARRTIPPIRMKYYDLGDFGGTQRSLANWILEVGGSTFRIKDALKRAKMRWNPQSKIWELRATLYAAGQFGRPAQQYARIRKLQDAAHKMLKPIIEAENNIIEAENEGAAGSAKKKTVQELVQMVRRDERIRNSLKDKYGIRMEYDFKGRYAPAGSEPQLFFIGDTYELRGLFKKFGLRWDQSKKGWKIPLMEYEAVKKQLIPALMRELKTASVKTAKIRPETPIEKAVWYAWDRLQGTEKFKKGYLDYIEGLGISAETSDLDDDDSRFGRLGYKLSSSAKTLERQSRSWRTAYNLSLEGKIQLDGKRLAKDLAKTLDGVQKSAKIARTLHIMFHNASGSEFEATLEANREEATAALKSSTHTIKAFQDAIKLALRG